MSKLLIAILFILSALVGVIITVGSLHVTSKSRKCLANCTTLLDGSVVSPLADGGDNARVEDYGFPFAFREHQQRDCFSAVPSDCARSVTVYSNMIYDFLIYFGASVVVLFGASWLVTRRRA